MATAVTVCKTFTFDSSHQLIGHKGKCANVHGHTYKLEVTVKGPTIKKPTSDEALTLEEYEGRLSDEGFVIDFGDLKSIVKDIIVDKLDHAFIAAGDEPILETLIASGSKVAQLGFRTTVENMAMYVCWKLREHDVPVYSVKMWETPTGWAEVFASDIPLTGPDYRKVGSCDCD